MKNKVALLLLVNIIFSFIFIFLLPEILYNDHVLVFGIGISIVLLEIPIGLNILKNKDEEKNNK